ncbi:hypothetical protein PanWU01x14_274470 [Parasponia andersonii]|uniref:DUF2828 domain-containing protein n=1 Tax=Parasponia andersonii TaxID=3476 RepID=A0A2P5B3G2_PARAD|nr:hypothetical protein PanWU01x14_274470 [Parasponia andersonii]
MGLTENLSPTFLSTGNPFLDFFFHIVPDTSPDDLIQRPGLAWAHDPLTTLKLICNLRGALADFGYLKDLPEILYRLLEGSQVRKIAKQEWRNRKRGKRFSWKFKRESEGKSEISEKEEEGVVENLEQLGNLTDKEKARSLRKQREIAKAKRALDRYENDSDYRFLYDCISDAFADLLKWDVKFLASGELNRLSLASKWCPSIDSSYDKCVLLCEGIARRVFPRDCDPEYEILEEAQYDYRIRDRLRKQVLVPLHKALDLPEVYMSANEWNSLPYHRVASVAMNNYKDLFSKHDNERFEEYLEKVRSGQAKIAAGVLPPHEIIGSLKDERWRKSCRASLGANG